MKIIGITGKAGSGKDSVAEYLSVHHYFERYSFATPIKQALNAMFDWPMSAWEDRVWKESILPHIGKSPRRMTQTLGTEWGRHIINPDLWIKIADQRIANIIQEAHRPDTFNVIEGIVIADCRFENEVSWIRSQGGSIWHIVRPGVESVESHSSEDGIAFNNDTDFILSNNVDLEGLFFKVDALLKHSAQGV